jgi:hypothetical protein
MHANTLKMRTAEAGARASRLWLPAPYRGEVGPASGRPCFAGFGPVKGAGLRRRAIKPAVAPAELDSRHNQL